ncbi:MAG TPA: glycosyltransferase [Ferruginibacter sp.]|nr:glycosyltransferase [Ferruginibacter sp.]HRE62960.1 glycosyltransferase [Ferruginibacter sp.]
MSTFNERLARAFMEEGHIVSIYTFSLQYPSILFPGSSQYSTEPAPKGLDIKVLINSINPFNWISVGKKIKKEKPDLIVVRYWLPFMGPCLGSILRIAKKNKHSKVVCIADNIIPHEKRPGDSAFTKYFIKPVDAFVTMSQKVLDDLKLFNHQKPAVFIPHPLYDNFGDKVPKETAREKLKINAGENVLLFFGFIRKYKGLDLLLEAMAILKDKVPHLKLLIAGEFYEDKKNYENQIAQLGIAKNLILHTDFIADSEIKYYLCAADLLVQPYRNATQSGVTPLAYHFEVPMVVTNVGALPAMVPHQKVGLVAEPTPASIASNIEQFFKIGASHFIPHIIEEKKKYNWHTMTNGIISLADKL